ncbi:MAG: Ig-like domain-containing protein, partial [Planctomycetaceae bacterium]|nr:Ig-like domain-containing protein [Planctomycetaceae bacterium]
MLDGSPWHNPFLPCDVDADGEVTTADESALSNYLDANDGGPVAVVPSGPPPEPDPLLYFDVDDNWIVDQVDLDAVTAAVDSEEAEEGSNTPPIAYDRGEDVGHNDVLDTNVDADDEDGDNLVFSLLSGPQHGTIVLSTNGNFHYDPENTYVGTDSFTFSVSDGQASDTGSFTIDVTNTRPDPSDWVYGMGVPHDRPFNSTFGAVDEDGDPVTYAVVSSTAHGSLQFDPDGHFTY